MTNEFYNNRKREKYWENYPTDRDYYLARCYYASTGDFKLDFENAMYFQNSKERSDQLMRIIYIYMNDTIEFIFNQRRIFRIEPSIISLTSNKVCKWMKYTNPKQYNELKFYISNRLLEIASKGDYSENDIKKTIIHIIAIFIEKMFIIL